MIDIKEVVLKAKEGGLVYYETHKLFTNKDMGKEMIVFSKRTISSRTILSEGREEDTDRYIGLDKEGWIQYTHDIQIGCGAISISNEWVKRLTDEDIISYLESEECLTAEYVSFMNKAYKIGGFWCQYIIYMREVGKRVIVNDNSFINIKQKEKEDVDIQSIYQLRMYQDGCVCDGIRPDKAILIASRFPEAVIKVVEQTNQLLDLDGNRYNIILRVWREEKVSYLK